MSRIAENNTRTKHSKEIAFLNQLCIDLKRGLLYGNPTINSERVNVTMDRMDKFTQVIAKLQQCKEQVRFK